MFRSVILAAANSRRVEKIVETAPFTRNVVRRFIAGDKADDALVRTRELIDEGLSVTIDYLGEDTTNAAQAEATRDEYLGLLDALAAAELTPAAEVSVKLSALGQVFDEKLALEHARAICAKATEAGTTVTLDAEDHTTTDSTLDLLGQLRADFPTTGAVLQAYLRRTEADCRELAAAGSRVRLCKGAYKEPESVAYQSRLEVDKSFVRCLNILMAGRGLSDDRVTRSAHRGHRGGPGEVVRSHRRTSSSSRCFSAYGPRSSAGSLRRGTPSGSTCPTGPSGTHT